MRDLASFAIQIQLFGIVGENLYPLIQQGQHLGRRTLKRIFAFYRIAANQK